MLSWLNFNQEIKYIMKKLIISFCFFTASAVFASSSTYAGSDADYAKTVKADGGVLYSLAKSSKSVMHIFDAMPKIRIYKYTGTAATKYFGKGDRGNDKSPHGRVIYPQHVTNQDYYMLAYTLPTANEASMLVQIDDYDLMDVGAKKQFADTVAEMKKMGVNAEMPAYEPAKPALLAAHHDMFAVAQNSKSLHELKVSERFADVSEAYVAHQTDISYFTGLIKNRYLIKIQLSGVNSLKTTSDVEEYISEYMSNLSLKGLSPTVGK